MRSPTSPSATSTLFLQLLRDRQWWLGSVVAAAGFALQAAALGLGSVLLVQALLVTSLLFALPINAWLSHRRVTRWDWMWAALLAAAVAVIVTVGNPTAGQSRASLETWTAVVAVLGPALVLCVVGASGVVRARSARCCWRWCPARCGALFAVLTKGVVDRLDDGFVGGCCARPELYAWALVGVAGTAWQQSSFRAGALTASLPTMTVTEPLVARCSASWCSVRRCDPGDAGWLTLIVAVAVMVVATAALARGEAASAPASNPPDAAISLVAC